MKKPEKEKLQFHNEGFASLSKEEYWMDVKRACYNQACDEWEKYHEEVLDKIERAPYRVVWDICDKFNLGAGGCPDSLIIEYIRKLQQQLNSLPSEEEIAEIAYRIDFQEDLKNIPRLAKAIHKRIKGGDNV